MEGRLAAARSVQFRDQATLEVIPASDPKWDVLVTKMPHDIYHRRSYHRLAERNDEGQALLAHYQEDDTIFCWPYLLRSLEDVAQDPHFFDVTSVYGYPGPIVTGDASPAFVHRAMQATFDWWRQCRVVSVFTRFSPLLRNHLGIQEATPISAQATRPDIGGPVSDVGRTVRIDLRTSADELLRGYDKVLRQNINRGMRSGLTMEVDEKWDNLDLFLDLYYETMERNHAARSYFFDRCRLRDVKTLLEESAHLVVLRSGADVAAAMILLEYQGIIHAHLAGVSARFAELSPLKVLIHQVALWGQGRNASTLDLGGGRGGAEDSLFQFKKKFSNQYLPFFVGRWILNQHKYDNLCQRYASNNSAKGNAESFFPEYRQPSDR